MAVKTVSQLEEFNNGIDFNTTSVGGKLRAFKDNPNAQIADRDASSDPAAETANPKCKGPNLQFANDTFYGALFEISQPERQGTDGLPTTSLIYNSRKITYLDLARNIILDTKNYLNTRNNLGDFNLCAIVGDKYTFSGDKTFEDNVNIRSMTTCNGGIIVNKSCKINCDIDAKGHTIYLEDNSNPSKGFLNGYAYGLKDNLTKKTTKGTNTNSIGNPIMFSNGRPAELTSVNHAQYALSARYIVGDSGLLDAGNDRTFVYFKNGVPLTSNTVRYAELAYSAQWSDLGEKYLADADYEPGTLVQFSGDKELTIAKDEVNAIVSTKAFELNTKLEGGTTIALCGRVPTKVVGKVNKFDKIVLSNIPGVARKRKWYDFFKKTIGRALESNQNKNIKLVECVTRFIVY